MIKITPGCNKATRKFKREARNPRLTARIGWHRPFSPKVSVATVVKY